MTSDNATQTMEMLVQIKDQVSELHSEATRTNERLDQTSERLDQTSERLDQTNERLDQTNERLESGFAEFAARLDRTNERLDTSIAWQQQTNHVIGRLEQEVAVMNRRFDNFLLGPHRYDHDDLRRRVERLEDFVGIDEP